MNKLIIIGMIITLGIVIIFITPSVKAKIDEMSKNVDLEYQAVVTAEVLLNEFNTPKITIEDKLEELKDEVRNKIMGIESGGIKVNDGEIFATFDPPKSMYESCRRIGGKMNLDCLSFGPLQFKISTIIYYEKKLNNRDLSEKEALKIAHDIDEASRLFDDIIYKEKGGISNWSAANNDWEYYANVIPIIRKLMD